MPRTANAGRIEPVHPLDLVTNIRELSMTGGGILLYGCEGETCSAILRPRPPFRATYTLNFTETATIGGGFV